MSRDADLEARLARFIERHAAGGAEPRLASLCEDRPDLEEPLRALVKAYLAVSADLSGAALPTIDVRGPRPTSADLPQFDGFRTIERLGGGGMGEVYKLEDLKLGRVVAGKVVRHDRRAAQAYRAFLGEARTLALFRDPRIVQIHEFRDDQDPPVIVMEFVDGFELGDVAASLEYRQRAHILEQVAEAVHHAHALGIQHRDLKPSNIMVDAALSPKILDFGLSGGSPGNGHLRGTVPYLAPEQLDPSAAIDARTDVYALGVILYQILCGARPYDAADEASVLAAIRAGDPRLPVEIAPSIPEPLQAIALKAMEREPSARYQSAHEMALDLRRFLDGRSVLARPRAYASALESRIRPHLDHISEWLRLRLIYPHEALRLRSAYHALEAREDDWILASRVLSYSQIALYLGAFFLLGGSLFYFNGYVQGKIVGMGKAVIVLGLPFAGLNVAANYLYQRERRAVAVAFYLGGLALLPLFLMILLRENHLLVVTPGTARQLFEDAYLSNHQLQVTLGLATAWALLLALRTRTAALSTVFTFLLFLWSLAILADFGLRDWVLKRRYDWFAWHVAPLVVLYVVLGHVFERTRRPWFAKPLYLAAALTLVLVIELLAQNGKAFGYLGLDMRVFRIDGDPASQLGNTLMAMAVGGVALYLVALLVDRRGSDAMRVAGGLLFAIAPFAALKPLGWLCHTSSYTYNFDWVYLALSLGSCVLSYREQRRSFYLAGLMNTGWALYEIATHREWTDKSAWAIALVVVGLVALADGYLLNVFERRRRAA